jgi:hypothetical protein
MECFLFFGFIHSFIHLSHHVWSSFYGWFSLGSSSRFQAWKQSLCTLRQNWISPSQFHSISHLSNTLCSLCCFWGYNFVLVLLQWVEFNFHKKIMIFLFYNEFLMTKFNVFTQIGLKTMKPPQCSCTHWGLSQLH